MKKVTFSVLFALLTPVLYAQYDPKALEVLEAMGKRYKGFPSFEANISYTLSNDVEKVNEEFKGKITVKGDKYKLAMPEQEVINNGATIWTYVPEAKEVNIDNFDPKSEDINPSKVFEMYKKGFKYLHLGEKTDGGVLCDEVDLVPEKKDAQFFKVKMYISKKDRSLQSWTMFDKSGNRYKYTITKFTPNVKVEDVFFSWDAKKFPGVEVIDLRN